MREGGGAAASASTCVLLLEMESTAWGGAWEEDDKFFFTGELWNMLEMSFFTEHQSAGPTILFPVFPHAEWGSLGESLSGRGHDCSFIYAYVLIFFF
jgi:hypothetical protein